MRAAALRSAVLVLTWACVAVAGVAFFLPWASIDVTAPGALARLRETAPLRGSVGGLTKELGRVVVKIRRGAETITGDLPTLADIPKQVSGAQIPGLANQQHAQVAIALFELMTSSRQQIGLKSYAVYLVPGIALLCGLLLTFIGSRLSIALGVAMFCAVVAGVGFWKLLTVDTRALFIAITIGPGLWLSLWAYVGLGATAGLQALIGGRRGARRSS